MISSHIPSVFLVFTSRFCAHHSWQEIKDATLIEESDLKRNLQSLACAKYKVLKKHPAGRDISNDDAFSFNLDGPMVSSVVVQGEFTGPSPAGLGACGYADAGNWVVTRLEEKFPQFPALPART